MKPEKLIERVPLRVSSKAVEALERLRFSYSGGVGAQPVSEADQAVQRVVELTLQNARAQRTA